MTRTYSTKEVAQMAGVHKETLLRWLRDGLVPEPSRDRHGWRVFSENDTLAVKTYVLHGRYMQKETDRAQDVDHGAYVVHLPYEDAAERMSEMDWDFDQANTSYLTHSLHPYPAKFIPQIPNALIQELSSVYETVLDPFCGSGTTLVEAMRLGRNTIGLDANPLACLISRAKTQQLSADQCGPLLELADQMQTDGRRLSCGELPGLDVSSLDRPTSPGIVNWFDAQVIDELSYVRNACENLEHPALIDVALASMSSIIVSVSRQDSETRYVRRDKSIEPGTTLLKFSTSLRDSCKRIIALNDESQPQITTRVLAKDVLTSPDIGRVHLVVCSPPYPNAFSYHLYHRTRMEWLRMDQPKFKAEEIGSHRKYSAKGVKSANIETFRSELGIILSWLVRTVEKNRHVCFVIGDSTIQGVKYDNAQILSEVASSLEYTVEAIIPRQLKSTKKYFNPKIGRIRTEKIVILRNTAGDQA